MTTVLPQITSDKTLDDTFVNTVVIIIKVHRWLLKVEDWGMHLWKFGYHKIMQSLSLLHLPNVHNYKELTEDNSFHKFAILCGHIDLAIWAGSISCSAELSMKKNLNLETRLIWEFAVCTIYFVDIVVHRFMFMCLTAARIPMHKHKK